MKIRSAITISCATALLIVACKKDNNSSSTDSSVELTAQADDQNRVSTEVDAVANDANTAISSSSSISGKVEGGGICDANISVDTTGTQKTVTIVYNGGGCLSTRTRTGTVVISMPKSMHWKDTGATVTVSIQSLKITRLADNKSITLNGSHTITNVTGGLLSDLSSRHTIIHTIASSGLTITFDDNTQRTWQVARKRTFTYDNGIVISETGNHTDGANTTIAEWGTNRNGNAFSTSISSPIVVRQDCNFRITSGSVTHTVPKASATATFGLDANGNAVSCPSGFYYLKLTWTVNGVSKSVMLPY